MSGLYFKPGLTPLLGIVVMFVGFVCFTAQKLKKEIKRSNDRTTSCRRERLLHAGSYSGTSLCVIKNNVTNSVVILEVFKL